jgi:hypothetical protein
VEPDAIGLVNEMIAVLEKIFPGDEKIPRVAPRQPETCNTAPNAGGENESPNA